MYHLQENGRKTLKTPLFTSKELLPTGQVLKSAERNYSATESEALALKEALVKFQPYIEGEEVLAITNHAALTWSTTFQNVNRRLLSWGTIFAAYPNLRIVHRAGRVHSNVDLISRLRRQIPPQEGNNRLCVPETLMTEVISKIHDGKTEGAHAGYH